MKPFLILIINLIFIIHASCQVTWFPTGAKWHYDFSSMLGGGLTTLEVLKEDTLIGNLKLRKILSTTQFDPFPGPLETFTEVFYVYEKDKVVTGYDKWSGEYLLLYNFNAVAGDTIPMTFGGISPYPFIVDSIGEIEINGKMLAFQDIQFPDIFEPEKLLTMRVFEVLGSPYSHLFHNRIVIQPTDFPSYRFRCYEDDEIGLINLSSDQLDCDYNLGNKYSSAHSAKSFVYPNPSNDYVTVKTYKQIIYKIIITDLSGYIQIVKYIASKDEYKINISTLAGGLYIMSGIDETGNVIFHEKLVKIDN